MTMCVYKIEHVCSGKCYIGSAVNFASRVRGHKRRLGKGTHHSPKLQNAWNKYGESAFVFEVLEVVPDRRLLIPAEQRWMDQVRPQYNIAKFAGSPLGVKQSDEARRKKSIANTGRVVSEETRAKLRATSIGRRPPSSMEIVVKRSEKLRGKRHGPDAIEKIRAARTGSKASPEARAKMSAAKLGIARGPFTDEHRANMSAAAKRRRQAEAAAQKPPETA